MRRRLFTRPKDADLPNEDAAAASRLTDCYALADGASSCYAGGAWARVLSRRYVRDPVVSAEWLAGARQAFRDRVIIDDADWLAQLAYARGNFATLLGFQIHSDRIEGVALGDTLLFVLTPHGVQHVPPMLAEDFRNDPVLLSSHQGIGRFAQTPEAIAALGFSLRAPDAGWSGCRLFAMTDALAAWVLSGDVPDRLASLGAVTDAAAFCGLVAANIESGEMRRDDATLLSLEL
nr:hypothetical protein [uncultured Rhodopila sp.]